jgi:GNAT superfamily N-acetyltransferase
LDQVSSTVSSAGEFVERQLRLDDPEYANALHLALDWPRPGGEAAYARRCAEFQDDNVRRGITASLVASIGPAERLLTSCLVLESPGRAALLVLPPAFPGPTGAASLAVLRRAVSLAWSRPIQLLQTLLAPQAGAARSLVESVGFSRLTNLIYLERAVWPKVPFVANPAKQVSWVDYSPQHDSLFQSAVQATYAQSLDCPELAGTRVLTDVLAGHRAAGDFEPALWSVAMVESRPIGVLLLAHLPKQRAIEVAYMGVALEGRGKQIADALLQRATVKAAERHANVLTLAVDERNAPARQLYRRWGFESFAERSAFIATSPPAEPCRKNHK